MAKTRFFCLWVTAAVALAGCDSVLGLDQRTLAEHADGKDGSVTVVPDATAMQPSSMDAEPGGGDEAPDVSSTQPDAAGIADASQDAPAFTCTPGGSCAAGD